MTDITLESDQRYMHLLAQIGSLNAYVSLLQERIKDAEEMNSETLHQFADRLGWKLVAKEEGMEWRWVEGPENAPAATLAIKGAKAPPPIVEAPKKEPDGPVEGYGWRCNGVVREGMPPASWKLANFLFTACQNKAASIGTLAVELDKRKPRDVVKNQNESTYEGRARKFNKFCADNGFNHCITIERGDWIKKGTSVGVDDYGDKFHAPIVGKDKDEPRTVRLNLHKGPRARRKVVPK